MKSWICRKENNALELIRSQLRPSHALCEMLPDVEALECVTVEWHYLPPGLDVSVKLLDEGALPPAYWRNPVTNTWATPVPDPIPEFWRDSQGRWFDSDPGEGTKHRAAVQVPGKFAKAVLNPAGLAAYQAARTVNARALKKHQIQQQYEGAVGQVKSRYPQSERDAWPQKEAEAQAWAALSSTDKTAAINAMAYPLLIGEALAGDTSGTAAQKKAKIDAVAEHVVANGQAYRIFSGTCTGILKKALAEIDAVPNGTLEEVQAALAAIAPTWPAV